MNWISIAQLVISVLLIGAILLQQRGTGITSLVGGNSMEYSTKRGAERVIFTASIVLIGLLAAVSIARLIAS